MTDRIEQVRFERLEWAILAIEITGWTPLIPHRWTEKALGLMRDKQSGPRVRASREAKDPDAEREATLYRLPDGRIGHPATAFKAALVDACRPYEGVTMVELRALLHVLGEGPEQLVPITGTLVPREDTPRNATGVADLRYRYEIRDWRATLQIEFLPSRLDTGSLISLVDTAGRCGVGDWRPASPRSRTGVYGQWRVVPRPDGSLPATVRYLRWGAADAEGGAA